MSESKENTLKGFTAREIIVIGITFFASMFVQDYLDDKKGIDPMQSTTQSQIQVMNNSLASIKLDVEEIKETQKRSVSDSDLQSVLEVLSKHAREIDEIKQTRYSRDDHDDYARRMEIEHSKIEKALDRILEKIDTYH